MATLQEAITLAKTRLNAAGTANLSWWESEDAVADANAAIKAIAGALPALFHADVELTCIANTTRQTLNVADSFGLVAVMNVKNGNAVTMTDQSVLDRFSPGWRSVAAATAENWMPVESDPFRFQIYPPAPSGQILICQHVEKPPEYLATATHRLPSGYTPVIALYIMAIVYLRDGKADLHAKTMSEFSDMLKLMGGA